MIKHAQQMGKKVAVPVIRGEDKLIASLLKNSDNALSPGPYGILQPRESRELSLEEIDLVIVPGVAFDKKGNRLGRGRGYYDRFLKDLTLRGIPSVGIAFDFQVVDNIPTLPHDLPVAKLITA
jgi:5-formyltetrahydrofolate cyclo-ligase